MKRTDNQPRPTAGCLSVPLFNQKKRSRLPLTSSPSENKMFSGSSIGYVQASTNRTPLAQRCEWNQQANPQPQQTKAWPTTSSGTTGWGYTPIPYPYKPPYARLQTGPQRPQGKQDSMATNQGFRQDGFQSVSGTSQAHPRPFIGEQPMKQQSFTSQTSLARVSSTPQQVLSSPTCSQGAGDHQNAQWKFKTVGHTTGGMWVEDTFDTSRTESSLQQQKSARLETKPATEKSLRILTAVIEGMKHWSQFNDKVPMLFEIFATLDSAVTVGKYGAKNFLMRNGKDVVPCVYYENDQVLPRLIRGQVHRCVGNYDRHKNVLTCVSVRPTSSLEQRNAQEAVRMSDTEMRNVVQALTEM
ncbi:spermatogenesis-associated protein 22 [Colossoma macropomum]|uniref:spermatogenesis-associated protein 22 n=1 Tax=Colossoma macropomum TaxID=42526 RepID=UPI0018642DC3|nr:spermatogenesis-associated protein 22 [Colossoma macropomum]